MSKIEKYKSAKGAEWLPQKVELLNQEGKVVGKEPLEKGIFDGYINTDLMHQAVRVYLANQRQGTVATKTRGLVSGGGKKPWRQKGTGRARFGSIRTPIWRHGGVVFGPQPRDFNQKFPKRMNTLAFKSALNAKLKDAEIIFLDDLKLDTPKTKAMVAIVKSLHLVGEKSLFLKKSVEKSLLLSARNVPYLCVRAASQAHTYTIMDCKRLVLTKDALFVLKQRIQGSAVGKKDGV